MIDCQACEVLDHSRQRVLVGLIHVLNDERGEGCDGVWGCTNELLWCDLQDQLSPVSSLLPASHQVLVERGYKIHPCGCQRQGFGPTVLKVLLFCLFDVTCSVLLALQSYPH